MIEVKPRDSSDIAFEKAYSVFKKTVAKDGFLKEVRDNRYFRKPSELKREYVRKAKREQARKLEIKVKKY